LSKLTKQNKTKNAYEIKITNIQKFWVHFFSSTLFFLSAFMIDWPFVCFRRGGDLRFPDRRGLWVGSSSRAVWSGIWCRPEPPRGRRFPPDPLLMPLGRKGLAWNFPALGRPFLGRF
jgi:hypothetical protein